jgi:hypothetical protein
LEINFWAGGEPAQCFFNRKIFTVQDKGCEKADRPESVRANSDIRTYLHQKQSSQEHRHHRQRFT